jgi:hypothetical protein
MEATTAQLTPTGDGKADLVVSGRLSNSGDTAITASVLKGSLLVAQNTATTSSHKLGGPGITDQVGIKKPWLPKESRSFQFTQKGLPLAQVSGDDLADRLVWITIKASNGKAYTYSGPVGAVDVVP